MSVADRLRELGRKPRAILLAALAIVVVWVTLLDSHSILKRVLWRIEISQLETENGQLVEEIDQITYDIEHAAEAENVERVARESYGMRRDGETVYRVESESD